MLPVYRRLEAQAAANAASTLLRKVISMIKTTQMTPLFTLGAPQTFRLSGPGLDSIHTVKITATNAPVTWSASVDSDKSPTSLLVTATPTHSGDGELTDGEDQMLIQPAGTHFKLDDKFVMNESVQIHCTVLSDGTTIYTPSQQLALVAKYQDEQTV